MKEETKGFLEKIKVNTRIYTFTFIAVGVYYAKMHTLGAEAFMLLIAAFAFYTLGRQIRLVTDIEAGIQVDTAPKELAWVRGIAYFVIILLVFSIMFV